MSWLAAATRELFALFIDDVPFSAAIAAWMAGGALLLPETGLDRRWDGPLLALGLAVILVVSVRLAAAERRRRSG